MLKLCQAGHICYSSENNYFMIGAMDEIISAADANREFSRLLREVREGNSFTVTSHGKPVARLVPIERDTRSKEEAFRRLQERWRNQPALNAGPWTRDELYDREK
jgi:prevent-host-death family protein